MKKYIFLSFVILTSEHSKAQYSITDAQIHKGQYFFSNFTSFKLNERIGVFLYTSLDHEYYDLAPGILFNSSTIVNTKGYWEIGIGGGATLSRKASERTYWYTQMYGWFETKPDKQLGKNKIIIQCSPAFTFNSEDHWWMLGYATYAATENISLGIHFQSESAKGFRLEYNIPRGKYGIVRFYTVAGKGALAGVSYIFQK